MPFKGELTELSRGSDRSVETEDDNQYSSVTAPIRGDIMGQPVGCFWAPAKPYEHHLSVMDQGPNDSAWWRVGFCFFAW